MAPWEDISPAAVWRRIVSTFKHAYVISIPISVNCRYAPRRTFWTDAEVWRNAHGGWSLVHPIFSLPATSIFNVRPDAMHLLDIGIALHVLGNVFSSAATRPLTSLGLAHHTVDANFFGAGAHT